MHLCGMSECSWKTVWDRIRDKFEAKELADGSVVFVNQRMDVDRDEAIASWKRNKEISNARRRSGKKGGFASGKSRAKPHNDQKTTIKQASNARSKNEANASAKCQQNEANQEEGKRNFPSVLPSPLSIDFPEDLHSPPLEQSSLVTSAREKNKKKFVTPSLDEVTAYCRERSNDVDPGRFLDFYESKGWLVGKAPMRDWKAAVRTWEHNSAKPSRVLTKEEMRQINEEGKIFD